MAANVTGTLWSLEDLYERAIVMERLGFNWSDEAEKRLRDWVENGDWDKGNATVFARFHKFVKAVWECNRILVSDAMLEAKIFDEVHAHHKLRDGWTDEDADDAKDVIHSRVREAAIIFDYLVSVETVDR